MSTRRRVAALVVAVSVVTSGLVACGSDPDQRPAPAGTRGGHLTYLDAEAPASLQIQVSYWQNSLLKDQMLDRLVYQDPKTFEFVPWIAERWTIDDSQLVYEFTIREGVTYSDGQVLDAESVRRNLDWQANGDKAKGITRNTYFPRSSPSRPTTTAASSGSRWPSRTRRSSPSCLSTPPGWSPTPRSTPARSSSRSSPT
ncbi:ABC transporter substrate-binding protein [Mycolicibacterium wolinskyi]|uniref:ABC transporter substrate-binding protein n=1 Tax=Mycolicibacterium wolinskyi TaxID=59750 RepID=UPI000833FAD6